MMAFDPWTSTLEQAREQPNAHELHGSVFQWVVANELTSKSDTIFSGDGFGVLQAVAKCAVFRLVMPAWLADAYLARFRAVQQCKVSSWDAIEAFGRPYAKGRQMAGLRRSRNNRFIVVRAVADAIARNPNLIIDVAFWEGIGQDCGEGKTSAQELHAEAVQAGYALSPSAQKSALLGR